MINPNANSLMLERYSNNTNDDKNNIEFNPVINNYSKYTSPAENVRLLRQEYQLYKLKYGGNR